jgi:hypothetical protein
MNILTRTFQQTRNGTGRHQSVGCGNVPVDEVGLHTATGVLESVREN